MPPKRRSNKATATAAVAAASTATEGTAALASASAPSAATAPAASSSASKTRTTASATASTSKKSSQEYGDEVEELPPLVSEDIGAQKKKSTTSTSRGVGGGALGGSSLAAAALAAAGGSSLAAAALAAAASASSASRAAAASAALDATHCIPAGGSGGSGGVSHPNQYHHHHHHSGGGININNNIASANADECLHCHTKLASTNSTTITKNADGTTTTTVSNNNNNIQVRCDECSRYICNNCHWCHEFQANHEIRVCDRCDAFYCKSCDEMDQCDDCGEVVCATCSTLLSCKFCGGGLCEDCATACGRCGIVLCSRDAKFAVDCDTCRLSYCLVCLASGSKDPCVRCGHRPSKRMEQLVHLRLKSIYKAFKQSSVRAASNVRDRQNDDPDECHVADDPEALLQAAASAAKNSNMSSPNHKRHRNSSSSHYGSAGGGDHSNKTGGGAGAGDASKTSSPRSESPDDMEHYMAEKQKADAAAAALLAELEEEEEAAKSKKSKKKNKKKKRQQLKREEEEEEEKMKVEEHHQMMEDDEEEEDEEEDDEDFDMMYDDSNEAMDILEAEIVEDDDDEVVEQEMEPEPPVSEGNPGLDPLEQQLCSLVADEDVEGLEQLLASVKGVPGRSTLRKNAKKALKRFRADNTESETAAALPGDFNDEAPLAASVGRSTATSTAATAAAELPNSVLRAHTPVTTTAAATSTTTHGDTVRTSELLKVVSHTHNKQPPQSSSAAARRGGGGGGGQQQGTGRTECIMHMAPLIVGWVIGKGGQRIRDLMEESGARIWIDQDSMGPSDPRIVYVSGQRKNVDTAVRMITELVAKAPAGTPLSKQNTPVVMDSSTKPPPPGSSSKAPSIPDSEHILSEPHTPVGLKPRHNTANTGDHVADPSSSAVAHTSSKSEHVMTCDPRFVPLLIGRRGWTIKNIQDSSGARVDIDQTVNPRKITISGIEENVRSAIQMVNDVLSYPHAQLQGATEDEVHPPVVVNEAIISAPTPAIENDVADFEHPPRQQQQQQQQESALDIHSPANISTPLDSGRRRAHSPPSSLIMTGDAKSTISASSSLSSTPEPTASSTTKASFAQVPPGPMLPPVFGFSPYNPTPGEAAAATPVQAQTRLPNGPMFSPGNPLSPAPQGNSLFGIGSPPGPMLHQVPLVQQLGASGLPAPVQSPGIADLGRPLHQASPFPMGQPASAFQQRNAGGLVGPPMPASNPVPVRHQQGAFHPTQTTGFPMSPNPLPPGQSAMLLNNDSNHSSGGVLPNASLWGGPGGPVVHGSPLANQRPPPSAVDFRLDAAVDFLQHSHPARSSSLPGGVNEVIGLPTPTSRPPMATSLKHSIGLERSTSAPVANLGPDDSRMIDSLFGPSNPAASESSLLTGLEGLSIGKEGLSSTGLWGSAVVGGDELRGLHSLGGIGDNKSSSHIFEAEPVGHQNPPQSRFGWGAYTEG